MAKNRAYSQGANLSLPVPEGVVSGQALVVGQIPCVALINRREDGTCELATRGVYEFEVEAKNKAGNVAVEVGDKLYLKGGVLGKNNEEGVYYGYALETIASGAKTKILVKVGY